jgi:Protein of unknown function (DUF1329)
MYIKKLTRRGFIKASGYAFGALGFASVADLIFAGKDWSLAYPEEVMTIESVTHGKVKTGDWITKANVDLLKDHLPVSAYHLVKRDLQNIKTKATSAPHECMSDYNFRDTEKARGEAVLDTKGNLRTKNGKKWTGGIPFYPPKTGLEAMWDHVIRSKRVDDNLNYNFTITTLRNEITTASFAYVALISNVPRESPYTTRHPYYSGYEDELYRILVVSTEPYDFKGLGSLTIQPYDQTKLPQLFAWNQFARRVLQFPTNQRFQLLTPGNPQYISDLTLHNDPLSTWDWSIAGVTPMLLPVNVGFEQDKVNYSDLAASNKAGDKLSFKGAVGLENVNVQSVMTGLWELRPEVRIIKGVSKDPDCPYSYKYLYQDNVTQELYCYASFDKHGTLWKFGDFERSMTHYVRPADQPVKMLEGIWPKDVMLSFYDFQGQTGEMSFTRGTCDSNLAESDYFTTVAMEKLVFSK